MSIIKNPLVSVIVPLFNAQNVLAETITSVLKQTHDNLEIIIVDDCSDDNSYNIASSLAVIDPRIQLIRNEKNSGPGFSRLKGIRVSSGHFIAFIDSDDLWESDKLSTQLNFMRINSAEFSYTAFRRFSINPITKVRTLGRLITVPRSMSYNDLLSNTAIATSTVIIDRNCLPSLEDIETSKIYVEDYVLFFEVLRKGIIAFGLNKVLMLYRVQPNSFSRNKLKYALKVWRTYRDIEGFDRLKTISFFSRYAARGFLKYLRF